MFTLSLYGIENGGIAILVTHLKAKEMNGISVQEESEWVLLLMYKLIIVKLTVWEQEGNDGIWIVAIMPLLLRLSHQPMQQLRLQVQDSTPLLEAERMKDIMFKSVNAF